MGANVFLELHNDVLTSILDKNIVWRNVAQIIILLKLPVSL